MRTFHIGGAASRSAADSNIIVKSSGIVRMTNIKTVTNKEGNLVAVSRSGELGIADAQGRIREKYKVPYGAVIKIADGDKVERGFEAATWDPHTHPIISEVAGIIDFVDFVEGSTIQKEIDSITGLSSTVVLDRNARPANAKDLHPVMRILDENGDSVFFENTSIPVQYPLAGGAIIGLTNGVRVDVGDVMARLPQESSKTRDITGGLPRVADLFEARKPKMAAILAEISGTFSWGKETKGKKRMMITPEHGDHYEMLVPKWRSFDVFEGEKVVKGEMIADGEPSPHDILRLLGPSVLAEYLVREIQEVYRLQGVKINDKHIEVIARQMMRKVLVTASGDSGLLRGEQLDFNKIIEINNKLHAEGKLPAKFDRLLLGITKASLVTDSFISAASFQETTRVLTEAAVNAARDDLRGLKENVIVGRLVPAGTGLAHHKSCQQKRQDAMMEQMSALAAAKEATEAQAVEQVKADSTQSDAS
jgi:DNA-directed RNA polymerase subunit beta'